MKRAMAIGLMVLLAAMAKARKTDGDYLPKLRGWASIQFALFLLFTILFLVPQKGTQTIYGAVYLLSLIFAIVMTLRMHKTIEAA